MAHFNTRNTRPRIDSPVTTTGAATTFEGASGFSRNPLSDLYLLSVSNLVGTDTFYEKADPRNERYIDLLHEVALTEPGHATRMLPWLRSDGYLRTAAVLGAAEVAKVLCDAHRYDGVEDMVDGILQRADEPGEFIAYWFSIAGKAWPRRYQPVKRGLKRAVRRLYTEYAYGKWDSPKRAYRFADVLNIVHPRPIGGVRSDTSCPTPDKRRFATPEAAPAVAQKGEHALRSYLCQCGWWHLTSKLDAERYQALHRESTSWQSDLFRYILDRHYGRKGRVTGNLTTVQALRQWRELAIADPSDRRLLDPDFIRAAGLTWEDVLSELGGRVDKRLLWEAVIPTVPVGALLRNLRNLDEVGISDGAAEQVAKVIADGERVRRARVFPYRFLAAYRAAPSLRWGAALERGLAGSLELVPALRGRTLILVDRSPSMFPGAWSSTPHRGDISLADQAALFGAALAVKAEDATLVEFGGDVNQGWYGRGGGAGSRRVAVPRGASVLKVVDSFGAPIPGTDIPRAVKDNYRPDHDRVVIVTDEQSRPGMLPSNMRHHGGMRETAIDDLIPKSTPVYLWNMAGYSASILDSGGANRHCFGGLSDASFGLIQLLEQGRNAPWPWMR